MKIEVWELEENYSDKKNGQLSSIKTPFEHLWYFQRLASEINMGGHKEFNLVTAASLHLFMWLSS